MHTFASAARSALVAAAVSTLAPAPAAAASVEPPLRVDFEADPLAYAFSGHSLHLGVGAGHFRFDVGAFGLDLPAFADSNEGFDASFTGFGAKAHVFLSDEGTGPFAGLGAGYVRTLIQRHGTALAARDSALGAGLEVGWLIPIHGGFYAKPWVGLNATFGADDAVLDGARYETPRFQVFPTVHLGYAF